MTANNTPDQALVQCRRCKLMVATLTKKKMCYSCTDKVAKRWRKK